MKISLHKLNQKIQRIIDRLTNLSNKQILLLMLPLAILFFIHKMFEDFEVEDKKSMEFQRIKDSLNQQQILSPQEIEYLHQWYERDYEKDLQKAQVMFDLSFETLKQEYSHNLDPTIPLIYKIPKYLIENPNDRQMHFIFFYFLKVHLKYSISQINHTKIQNIVISPQELHLFHDLFQAYKTLMEVDSTQGLTLASAFSLVSYYMVIAESNTNYCEILGDLRDKLDIVAEDMSAMGQNINEVEIIKHISSNNAIIKELRSCQ